MIGRRQWLKVVAAVPLLLLVRESVALAAVPISRQALLLLRILCYDRNLHARAGDSANIVIALRRGHDDSERVARGLHAALGEFARTATIASLPIRVALSPFTSAKEFEATIASGRTAAVYVAPGLGDKVAEISATTRRHSVLSIACSAIDVEGGLSVGIIERDDAPKILVHLAHARSEGVKFDSALLGIAEVIR